MRNCRSPRATRLVESAVLASFVVSWCAVGCDRRSATKLGVGSAAASSNAVVDARPSPSKSATTSSATPLRGLERLSFATHAGAAAYVQDKGAGAWGVECLSRRSCPALPKLVTCPSVPQPIEAPMLGDTPPGPIGEIVAVRGPLGLAVMTSTMAACRSLDTRRPCCNHLSIAAFVGQPPGAAHLVGLGCGGDESRLCCKVPAFGQTVVAIGKLARDEDYLDARSAGVRWSLVDAHLCTDARDAQPRRPSTARPKVE